MKIIPVLIVCLFIAGCGMDQSEIIKAQEVCKNFGGVKMIYFFPSTEVVCNNGFRISSFDEIPGR